jgi:mono/diheme cytochrome c family protein
MNAAVGRAFALCIGAVALVTAPSGVAQEPPAAKPYSVECGPDAEEGGATTCRVDRATYVGWRTFHAICHTCHGQDALGSSFAPDLVVRVRDVDKATFLKAMNEGFTGQMGVMPPWKQDPNVNKYFEELWSYLQARKDGVLLPGRPKRLPTNP